MFGKGIDRKAIADGNYHSRCLHVLEAMGLPELHWQNIAAERGYAVRVKATFAPRSFPLTLAPQLETDASLTVVVSKRLIPKSPPRIRF